jgi:hypothetical protein
MATLPIVVPFQTPAQKYEIVKQAIVNRKPIGAIYDGKVRCYVHMSLASIKTVDFRPFSTSTAA